MSSEKRPSAEEILEVLGGVEDPELRMSVTELGLIYGIDVNDEGVVTVDMTLTSPACPVGPMLQGQIYHSVMQMDGVLDTEVNLVWEPPWDPKTMASDDTKLMLGVW
jgi:metal-sulfur cluster biosynthetic enzyme